MGFWNLIKFFQETLIVVLFLSVCNWIYITSCTKYYWGYVRKFVQFTKIAHYMGNAIQRLGKTKTMQYNTVI